MIAALAVYAYAFTRLAFLLSIIPLMLVLLRAIDPVRWTVALSGTPESGIIMMAGIYYGSMYGGSTTSNSTTASASCRW